MGPLQRLRPFAGRLLLMVLLLIAFPVFAYEPPPDPRDTPLASSEEDIEDLLGIMESPTKREAFIKNLKGLLDAKRAMEAKKTHKGTDLKDQQTVILRLVFDQLDRISMDFQRETIALELMAEELPETFAAAKTFFLKTENRPRLRVLLLDAAVALLAALLFTLFLRRPLRSATVRMKNLPSKIGWGFVYILLKALPFAVLFILFDIMFRSFPSFSKGRTLVLLLFTLLFFYQVVMAALHVILSPEETHARLAPFSDEDANYLWIWARRFALYTFFYLMVTRAFLWTQEPQIYYAYLRGLLLLPFPPHAHRVHFPASP